MADVLVIGSGGREQALAWKLAQSEQVNKVYVAPGNGGSRGIVQNIDIDFIDVAGLLLFAKEHNISLTVVGQEAASAVGVVDSFKTAGMAIFGPTKAATQIEASKAFAKQLMANAGIPTAEFKAFSDPEEAIAYAESRPLPVVIKADGLALGKGVVIAEDKEQIAKAIDNMMIKRVFGESGDKVVVEDYMVGQEVSVHALTDGQKSVIFPASQDHKQINDNDQGPNTGGMGVIAPVPWVNQDMLNEINDKIVQPALKELRDHDATFTGCLYPGLMIHNTNMRLLEFNARFGDPEAEVYMRLLDGDLYEIFLSCANGTFDPSTIAWIPGFAASVVACSPGYPGNYPKGLLITGIEAAESISDVVVFHAGTKKTSKGLETSGGRVLNVTATGTTLNEALEKAYAAIKLIHFEGIHYRTDIGRRPVSSAE